MKLKQKILNGFDKLHLKIYEQQLFMTLDESLKGFFPCESFIEQTLNLISLADKKYTFIHNVNFLPFNTRNSDWLAEYIIEMTRFRRNLKNKKEIPFNSVKRYVETSEKFKTLRDEYEYRLVRQYIKNLLNNNMDDFFVKKAEKAKLMKDSSYDLVFRKKVVAAITSLGIPQGVVDECIERSLDIWHKPTMHKTFYNRLEQEPNQINREQRYNLSTNNPLLWESLAKKELQFFNLWVSAREDEHIVKYEDVLKRVNAPILVKKMSQAHSYKLNAEVRQARNEYKKVLKQASQEVSHTQVKGQIEKGL